MPTFSPKRNSYTTHDKGKQVVRLLKRAVFEQFNANILGLGNIQQNSAAKPAIAAVFDLEGFTNFCKQIEPQLSVPIFLSEFLDWFFDEIRKETCREEFEEGYQLWHPLPFLAKFMGDGLLLLWDISDVGTTQQHNLITSLNEIANHYSSKFLPQMKKRVSDVPTALRCGVAKGTVYSVGNGNDFVGPCINLAARLQKLDGLKFSFARRGFNPEKQWQDSQNILKRWVLKKVSIRGMGDGELVYVRKTEFVALSEADSSKYQEP